MNALRSLSVEQQVALLFLILFGLLGAATAAVFVRSFRSQDSDPLDKHPQLIRDLRALWIGTLVFWLSWVAGAMGATLLFGVFSFLALREFITLAHTRRSDHRSLILAFFVVLPMQYMLVGLRSFDLFSVFIPVYVFLAIPVLSALAGDPERFLERNAKIQWGIMVCVFGLSHAPALLLLELKDYSGRGAFLLFFLVMASATAQIVQELFSRWLRRRPVARHIDRSFSYRAGSAGQRPRRWWACCWFGSRPSGRGRRRRWAASPVPAARSASSSMKALKKDAGVRYWGNQASVTGAVGLLDRVAPLCFAAPVFFHSVRWYSSLGAVTP